MRRFWKWAVVGVSVFLVVSYGVYAMAYQGNYNVTVSGSIVRSDQGVITVSQIEVESEPCNVFDYFDQLKGHSGTDDSWKNYSVYAELSRGDDVYSGATYIVFEGSDITYSWSVGVDNVPAGVYDLEITVIVKLTDNICWQQSSEVVVGP